MKKFLLRYHWLLLVVILSFAFLTRIYRVDLPKTYVFDEVYHAVTAKLINRGDPWAYQWWNPPVEPNTAVDWLHPPLAKYTQAMSMHIFGENSFGWRFSSVVFGVLVIVATYKLTLTLFGRPTMALLAAGLASLDGLLLVQSRIAMNDIHVTFCILVCLICAIRYLRAKWAWVESKYQPELLGKAWFWSAATGSLAGLAMGTKWSGAFVLAFVLLCEAATWLWVWLKTKQFHLKQLQLISFNFLAFVLLPCVIYVLSYIHMFSLGHSLACHQQREIQTQCYWEQIKIGERVVIEGYKSHFFELHRQIWIYQTSLEATHPYQSRPWQWFLDLRPVWYHVEYTESGKTANIYAFGNPLLFWIGDLAILASLIYLAQQWWKTRRPTHLALAFLVASFFIVWAPWARSPRIMFFYHYTPAVPLLAINLAYWMRELWLKKKDPEIYRSLVLVSLALIAMTFIVWYPNWTALSVDENWAKAIYFILPSWK